MKKSVDTYKRLWYIRKRHLNLELVDTKESQKKWKKCWQSGFKFDIVERRWHKLSKQNIPRKTVDKKIKKSVDKQKRIWYIKNAAWEKAKMFFEN